MSANTSRRRVAASQGVATKANVPAARFAEAFLSGSRAVETKKGELDFATKDQLTKCFEALEGVPPVTQEDFTANWKPALEVALKAAKKPDGSPVYGEKTIAPTIGRLAPVILGITNHIIERLPSHTVVSYGAAARPKLIEKGVYKPANKGGAKGGAANAKRQASQAKKAQSEFVTACEVVSLHNATLADNLALVMADAEGRKELETLVAEIAEEIRAKDKEEEKTSRRRK